MPQNQLAIGSPLSHKARQTPWFFIKDGYSYAVTREKQFSRGLLMEGGCGYYLQRQDSLLDLDEHLRSIHLPQINAFKDAYTRSISQLSAEQITTRGKSASDLQFFINVLIPIYLKQFTGTGAEWSMQASEDNFLSLIPPESAVINKVIYAICPNQKGSIMIDNTLYSYSRAISPLSGFDLAYNRIIELEYTKEIDRNFNAINSLANISPADLLRLDRHGTRFEFREIGFDSGLGKFYHYIPAFRHCSGTSYGDKEVAIAASINNGRLGNDLSCLVKAQNSMQDKSGSLCTGSVSGLARNNLVDDMKVVIQLCHDIKYSGFFHSSENN